MDTIDNLKKLFSKEYWRYSVLVVWLLIGISVIQFWPIAGIIIFLPFLTFLLFLYLLSIFSKKNIEEYSPRKILLLLLISLPLMLLVSLILVILFVISIILYIFFTSWFILYGCYLSGKQIDEQLKKRRYHSFTRGIELFGGFILSIFLLVIFSVTSITYAIMSPEIPVFLNAVFIIVGIIIIAFSVICTRLVFKKILVGWTGVFFILIVCYTFFLVLKVFLGLGSSGGSSLSTKIVLLLLDFFIIIYSISTILGSQAKLLTAKLKYFGIDTVLIGLIFSKVAYEFSVNFPYELLKFVPFFSSIPYIEYIADVGSDLNLYKNIAVLICFLFLLIIIGIYEIRKYILIEKSLKEEAIPEVERAEVEPEVERIEVEPEVERAEMEPEVERAEMGPEVEKTEEIPEEDKVEDVDESNKIDELDNLKDDF